MQIYYLWKNEKYLIFKITITVITVLPFVGPVLYLFVTDRTQEQSLSHQNRSSRTSNLWGWGRYTDNWNEEKKRMQSKIDHLTEITKDNDDKT